MAPSVCRPDLLLEAIPTAAIKGQMGSSLLGSMRREWAVIWCREFHRKHYQSTVLDSNRIKVRCECCGRKFIREKHKRYLVG